MLASGAIRGTVVRLYAGLIVANLAAWMCALMAFRGHPALLGTALLAWVCGLRHAVDGDHIAAIDNVVRKLMQAGQAPVGAGLWFATGHSVVVALACLAVALASATPLWLDTAQRFGAVAGTAVSAGFLLMIAISNLAILRTTWRRRGAPQDLSQDPTRQPGLIGRLCAPAFRLVTASWHMAPLGFLFGLGFDTATEVGLLGLSAREASHGAGAWQVMVFPALFAAGMALVDATDSVLSVGAYGWAFIEPARKIAYNMAITGVSAALALIVGAVELLGSAGGEAVPGTAFWRAISWLNESPGILGAAVVTIVLLCWGGSVALWRRHGTLRSRIGKAA